MSDYRQTNSPVIVFLVGAGLYALSYLAPAFLYFEPGSAGFWWSRCAAKGMLAIGAAFFAIKGASPFLFDRPSPWTVMVRGLLLWVLLLPIVLLLGYYRDDEGSQRSALDLQAMTDPAEIAAFFVLLVLVTPLFEEFVFRGLIHRAFRLAIPTDRAPVAIVCGGAVFALVHEPAVWPEVLALGVLLGYLYDRTRTIWVPVAVHVVHNLTAFLFIRWS